jgi:hypothetical protein
MEHCAPDCQCGWLQRTCRGFGEVDCIGPVILGGLITIGVPLGLLIEMVRGLLFTPTVSFPKFKAFGKMDIRQTIRLVSGPTHLYR